MIICHFPPPLILSDSIFIVPWVEESGATYRYLPATVAVAVTVTVGHATLQIIMNDRHRQRVGRRRGGHDEQQQQQSHPDFSSRRPTQQQLFSSMQFMPPPSSLSNSQTYHAARRRNVDTTHPLLSNRVGILVIYIIFHMESSSADHSWSIVSYDYCCCCWGRTIIMNVLAVLAALQIPIMEMMSMLIS